MEEAIKIWLFNVLKVSSKPSTFERYEIIYRLYVKDSIVASKKLDEIKGIDIQRFYNSEFKRLQNENKIKSINKLLKYFFNYAVKEDYILKNPCVGAIIPKEINKEKKQIQPFTKDEIDKIIKEVQNKNYELIFLFAILTGARQGEILALTKKDINLNNCEINISKNLKIAKIFNDNEEDNNYKYEILTQTTKTKNGTRTVPFPKKLQLKIETHIEVQKNKFGKLNKQFSDDSLLFTSYNGEPFNARNLIRIHERLLKRIGIPYRNFHTFRHTFATRLFELEVPLKTVSVLLGHSDINITANTYTHIMPKQKLEALEKLENLIDL